MRFPELVARISGVDGAAQAAAGRSLQQVMSLRNWLIGACIVEFEQDGEDRARYGQRLIPSLAEALVDAGHQGLSRTNLKNFRQVTLTYPGLDPSRLGSLPALAMLNFGQTSGVSGTDGKIRQTSGESERLARDGEESAGPDHPESTRQTSAESVAVLFPSLAARAADDDQYPWRDTDWFARLFTTLSFSHLLELTRLDDLPRRAFYELHCLKERWSVKELQRQRDSLLYERIGLSESREEVLALARQGTLDESPAAQLRDPYVFEFLGIEQRAVMTEGGLEQALIDHLQQFLLELGRDFCFVARQFRITAGNRHHYLDLLFFHRRLGCLVAIELKLGSFHPEHAGQLRFYVNYLAEHETRPGENPPVGILLCAERDAEVVRFATAGDEDLFVTRYRLELPSEDQLRTWLHDERARIEVSTAEGARAADAVRVKVSSTADKEDS